MMVHIKRLSKDAAFYGGGRALSQLFSFILAPIMTAIFSPAEYGIMSLLQTVFGFMIVIALINVGSGVFFYFYDTDDKSDKKNIISTSFFFHLIIASFFATLIWIFASYFSGLLNIRDIDVDYQDYTKYIRILSVGLFFSIIKNEFQSVLRMLRRPKQFFIMTLIEIITGLCLTILLVVVLEKGIEGAFYAGIMTTITACLVGFFMVKDQYVSKFSFIYLGLFFSYALPQFPSVFFNWGLSQSNRFFLNYYSTLTEQGLYSIGLKVSSVFLLFSIAFRMAWDPFAFSIMKKDHAKETYRKFYNYYALFFIWAASGVALFGKPLLILLTPIEYHSAYMIIGILVFAFFLQTGNNMLGIGISITKKTKYISYIQAIVFIAVVALSLFLIPKYDAMGAAFVFLIGTVIQSILYFVIAEKLHRINYNFWRMLFFSIIIFTCTQSGLYFLADQNNLIYSILYASVFMLAITVMIILMLYNVDKQSLNSALLYLRKRTQ